MSVGPWWGWHCWWLSWGLGFTQRSLAMGTAAVGSMREVSWGITRPRMVAWESLCLAALGGSGAPAMWQGAGPWSIRHQSPNQVTPACQGAGLQGIHCQSPNLVTSVCWGAGLQTSIAGPQAGSRLHAGERCPGSPRACVCPGSLRTPVQGPLC